LKLKKEDVTNYNLLDKTSLFLEDKFNKIKIERIKNNVKKVKNKLSEVSSISLNFIKKNFKKRSLL